MSKTTKRPRKPLPEELFKLTKEDAASRLLYRYEKDNVKGSPTQDVMVKVAYAVKLTCGSSCEDGVFLLKNLNCYQIRHFCRHLGVRGMTSSPIFFCRRALYAVFTKDDNVDRSLTAFKNRHHQPPSPVPSGTVTTAMAQPVNTSVQPFLPLNTTGALVARSVQPFPAGNNAATTHNRFSSEREKEYPDGNLGTCVASVPSRKHNGSTDTMVAPSVAPFHAARIKKESLEAAGVDTAGSVPLPAEHCPTGSSEANVDRLVLDFLSETNDGSSDTDRDSSVVHPWLLSVNNTNHSDLGAEIEDLLMNTTNHSARNGDMETLVVNTGNTTHSSQGTEMATIVQPFASEKNQDSTNPMQMGTSEQEQFPDETINGSPALGVAVGNSTNGSDAAESSPPQEEQDQKASLQSLERQQQQRPGTETTEAKGMFEYFKQNMDEDHEIKKEDLSLRKEDLALRKQDLEIKRKRNLQEAMNQTLQNYMNPACPPEIKDTLLEQWKRMDAEFKSI